MTDFESLITVRGYWLDDPHTEEISVLVSPGSWDGEDDAEIFFYLDGNPLCVGDVIAGNFRVTERD